jgi:peroxiredoxin
MKDKKSKNKKISEKKQQSSSKGRFVIFAVVAGAISGYLLFKASQEPEQPRDEPAQPVASSTPPSRPKELTKGAPLPEVALLSLAGEPLQLRAGEGSNPILLYVFSPTCSICTETIPTWKELAVEAESRSAEILGISVLDPARTEPYVAQHRLPWPVYSAANRETIVALGIQRVPMTFVINSGGSVAMVIRGKLGEEHKNGISTFLQGEESLAGDQ